MLNINVRLKTFPGLKLLFYLCVSTYNQQLFTKGNLRCLLRPQFLRQTNENYRAYSWYSIGACSGFPNRCCANFFRAKPNFPLFGAKHQVWRWGNLGVALGNSEVALRKVKSLYMAPKVGEKGVALKVGEKAASHLTPLHAPSYEVLTHNCTNRKTSFHFLLPRKSGVSLPLPLFRLLVVGNDFKGRKRKGQIRFGQVRLARLWGRALVKNNIFHSPFKQFAHFFTNQGPINGCKGSLRVPPGSPDFSEFS